MIQNKIDNDDGRARRWAIYGGVAAVLAVPIAVVAIIVQVATAGGDASPPDASPTLAAQTSSAPLPPTTAAPTTASPSATSEPPTAPPSGDGASPVLLNTLESVNDAYIKTDPTDLGGTTYVDLVRQDAHGCNKQRADYNLAKQYARFTAKAGLRDDYDRPELAWTFAVYNVDGGTERALFKKIIKFGDVVPVNVSVAGVLRLRLSIERADSRAPCRPFNGFDAVWAEPTLTPKT